MADKKGSWGGKRDYQPGRPPIPAILRMHILPVRLPLRQIMKIDLEVKRMNSHKSRLGKKPVTRADIIRRLVDLNL